MRARVSLGLFVLLGGCSRAPGDATERPLDMAIAADLAVGPDFSFPNWEVCGLARDAGAAITADLAPTSTGPTQAPNFRIDAQHTGAQPRETLTPPLNQAWSLKVGPYVNYALVADGRVFVTNGGGWPVAGSIVAADTRTGAVLWGPRQLGNHGLLAAYDDGRVFALDGDGLMTALDATSGHPLWSTQLTDESFFFTPPVTSNGVIYVGGAGIGGVIYAVDEAKGHVLWTARTFDGSEGTVAVWNGIVYDAEACAQVYAFDGKTGGLVWHHCTGCAGGGGSAPTAYQGMLYVRDDGVTLQNAALDLLTGAQVGTLPMPKADGALSVQGGNGYLLNSVNLSGELRAIALDTNSVAWSVSDIDFLGSPMVAGSYVYVGLTTSTLKGLDINSGEVVWTTSVGGTINSMPEVDSMTVAEGTLFVPVGDKLLAFR